MKTIKVTFESNYRVKEGRKWIDKTSQWDEFIKDEKEAKLRALALNWRIVKIERCLE